MVAETAERKERARQGGNRTKVGFDVLWSWSMGSTSRPGRQKCGKRKDGTYAFDVPHNLKNGRSVCHTDPLQLESIAYFKKKLWIVAGLVLDILDPSYKEGGWCLYASCKDDASEINWHEDANDVLHQYWVKLGEFENEYVDFGSPEYTGSRKRTGLRGLDRSYFGSRKEGEPYPVLKCDTRGWHRTRKPNFEGVSYSLVFFKMYDSTQTSLPPRLWPPVYV